MDILLKINQGTGRLTGKSLCLTCRYSRVMTTRRETTTICQEDSTAQLITDPVLECSAYFNKTLQSRKDFEEIAWTIDVNKRRVGFAGAVTIKPPTKESE